LTPPNLDLFPLSGARSVPCDLIVPGKYQPRKRFVEKYMQELAANIKLQGVMQPILLRPIDGGKFEIVAGERRWRATVMAGLDAIPAMARELTLMQVLELQAIENIQREDLHPLEEAYSFNLLLSPPDDSEGYSVAKIAETVSKDQSHVRRRLVLCQLIPQACDAFLAEQITLATAMAIARMPVDIQAKAFPKIMATRPSEDKPVAHKDAERILVGAFMLRLSQAPFPIKDASLVPAAGGCNVCPKRTGANPDLFFDVDEADTCTDPDCHSTKLQAWNDRRKAEARSAGIEVIDGKKASALLKFGPDSTQLNADYVYLDEPLEELTGSKQPLTKILGTLIKPSALYEHPRDHTLREIVHTHKARQVLSDEDLLVRKPKKGEQTALVTPAKPTKASSNTREADAQQQQAERERLATEVAKQAAKDKAREATERAWRTELFKAMHVAMHDSGYLPSDRLLAIAVADMGYWACNGDEDKWLLLSELWGWVEGEDYLGHEGMQQRFNGVTAEMNQDQLAILAGELAMLADLDIAGPDENPRSLVMVRACLDREDDDVMHEFAEIDWQAIHDRHTSKPAPKKGKKQAKEEPTATVQNPPDPTISPSPAGEQKGAATDDVASTLATENHIQAPSAQTRNEGSDLAHWVGQMVRVKKAKRVGEVVGLRKDGSLDVVVSSWRTGKPSVNHLMSADVTVLPDQVKGSPWIVARAGHVVDIPADGCQGVLVERKSPTTWSVKQLPSAQSSWPFPDPKTYAIAELQLTGEYQHQGPAESSDEEGES